MNQCRCLSCCIEMEHKTQRVLDNLGGNGMRGMGGAIVEFYPQLRAASASTGA